MNINEAFPSKYLKASDLQGRSIPVVMDRVEMEDIGRGEEKLILYFQGKAKGMVLNKTNANNIAALYTPDTDNWAGRQIVLFEAMVDFQGKTVPALRIKAPQMNGAGKTKTKQVFNDADMPPSDMSDEIPF